MRADGAGAKTWLLGALALWAVCVWLLTLFGLGARVDRLPEDPALLQPLPLAGKPPPERLAPLPQYAEIARRPLFAEDRKPQAFFINPEGEGDQSNGFDFVLSSVMIAPGFEMAILQPSGGGESVRVKVGDAPESAPSWTLASINPRGAVFNGPEGERKLELRVYNGVGGEPPTAISGGGMPMPTQPPGGMGMPAPPPPRPGAQKEADATPAPPAPTPVQDPANPPEDAADTPSSEQIDAIRKRIEERRARLQQEALTPPPPSQKP